MYDIFHDAVVLVFIQLIDFTGGGGASFPLSSYLQINSSN